MSSMPPHFFSNYFLNPGATIAPGARGSFLFSFFFFFRLCATQSGLLLFKDERSSFSKFIPRHFWKKIVDPLISPPPLLFLPGAGNAVSDHLVSPPPFYVT